MRALPESCLVKPAHNTKQQEFKMHASKHEKCNRESYTRASPNRSIREGWKDIRRSCRGVGTCETE